MREFKTDVLVVGGGTGATAAAIQAARRGVQTTLVSEFPWLGGMLTTAGVTAPDGNELAAFQTGIWGAFLRQLRQRQPGGLDHAWVSFFTYEPRIGAEIFANWVRSLPNLHWISGQVPLAVEQQNSRLTAVHFRDYTIQADIILDGTELGDLLAQANVSHRWGWDWQAQWSEPSAPIAPNALTQRYAVQAPTWVFVLQAFQTAQPSIAAPPIDHPEQFAETWTGYGTEQFLNYGRLPGNRFMINWPQSGNDYGIGLDRLIQFPEKRQEWLQEAYWHAQSYARFLQTQLGQHYGLAQDTFPTADPAIAPLGGGAFALHPYFRESRRLQGLLTVREQDILPHPNGRVAPLPVDPTGQVEAIAIGNYANDHHYPGMELPLKPKSIRWGGRWTGTPFALPYRCLIPMETDGLLVCEKNISVSHIANGATRLQPVVLGVGQAAGMAAALCIEQNCQPRELSVRVLQEALIEDPIAPAAIVPLFNLPAEHPEWRKWQRYYLDHPENYPLSGNCPAVPAQFQFTDNHHGLTLFTGQFQQQNEQDYSLTLANPGDRPPILVSLVTLRAEVDEQLKQCVSGKQIKLWGRLNLAGNWLLVEQILNDQ